MAISSKAKTRKPSGKTTGVSAAAGVGPVDLAQRLSTLRTEMAHHQLDAYIVPSSDEHLNEYLPEAHRRREWMSGFSGSAGDFAITCETARVFVDSRYYEQSDYEVNAHQVETSKLGLEGHPSLKEFLGQVAQQLAAKKGASPCRIGFDPATLGVDQYKDLTTLSRRSPIEWVPVAGNLVDAVRQQKPFVQSKNEYSSSIYRISEVITGESLASKIKRVREFMINNSLALLPLIKLDQVAWLFNLRGKDIEYNPLFLSFALLSRDKTYLFADEHRLTQEARAALGKDVDILPYGDYAKTLSNLVKELAQKAQPVNVGLDPKHATVETQQLIEAAGGQVIERDHPVQSMKAVKNKTELVGMALANLKASRGKIRALHWLSEQTRGLKRRAYAPVSEEDFRQAIESFYAQEPDYVGLSFNTIAGTGPNSSIVHYGTPNPEAYLREGDLFLIDSGVQFAQGTTDDTRTVVVGKPTALQRQRYTAVLKAHIDCARQKFPKGTEGIRLDGITRSALWNEGLDYGHGTGHGVGACLNVHEGPNGIHRMAKEPFQPGMITSIEPGFYQPGWGGIRLENLYASCHEARIKSADGRPWYGFETLTYIPFDKRLIVLSALSREQLSWLRKYHRAIVRKMTPLLSPDELRWLKQYCKI